MKVIIKVWEPDKPHELHGGMPSLIILEYDKFGSPEVIGHDVPIERCIYSNGYLKVCLDKSPTRIDADPTFEAIHLLNEDMAQYYSHAYTILEKDEDKGIILWTNPNRVMAKVK